MARVERAGDGSWTASMMDGDQIVLGTGGTRDTALDDLRQGVEILAHRLKAEGRTLAQIDYAIIEVAA